MTRRRFARGEAQEPGEPLLAIAGVPPLPGSISCAPGPGRVHGDRPRLSMNRRPKKDAPRSVGNRCGARFLAPFLTRRAEDERYRGSPADRAGVSNDRRSGRGDAGGHGMPAERSTSRLGAPQAGAPWGAAWLSDRPNQSRNIQIRCGRTEARSAPNRPKRTTAATSGVTDRGGGHPVGVEDGPRTRSRSVARSAPCYTITSPLQSRSGATSLPTSVSLLDRLEVAGPGTSDWR